MTTQLKPHQQPLWLCKRNVYLYFSLNLRFLCSSESHASHRRRHKLCQLCSTNKGNPRTIQTALSALLYINTVHISLCFSKDLVQNVCVCLNDYESESSGKKSGHTRSVQNIIGTVTNPQRISNSAFLDMVHVIACGKDGCRNDLPLPPTKIQGNENIIDLCGENDIFAEPFTSGTALSKNHSKLRWMKSLIRYERSRWMLRGAYGEDSKTEAVRQGIL